MLENIVEGPAGLLGAAGDILEGSEEVLGVAGDILEVAGEILQGPEGVLAPPWRRYGRFLSTPDSGST